MAAATESTNYTVDSVPDWFCSCERFRPDCFFVNRLCPSHHFPYYDPLLLRVFRIGVLISLGGIVFGISGVWRPSPLRWHAPVCAVGMLTFWILAASGE
jgi:hypothetical protein